MINNLTLQPLRNSEYLQFITDTLNILSKNSPEALNISAQYNALSNAKDEVEKLFKISQSSLVTTEIEVLDKRRDDAINGINLLVQAFAYSADAVVNKHGKTLTAHLALFGPRIAIENYQSETTILRNIANDWKNKPELQEAVTALNLGSWLTELETANNEFNLAYIKRNEELAMAPTEKLKELRNTANSLYYKLRTRINSNLDINDGAEPWATTVNLLNQNISTYTLLQTRRTAGTGGTEVTG
jgi:tRNA nucleotidyltransferase/poly(A) polymerase